MNKQYLVTERTHYMCPNMHFGIVLELDKEYQPDILKRALTDMSDAHPFLRATISYEEGTDRLFYNVTSTSQIEVNVREDDSALWHEYDQISAQAWNIFEEGLLKVYVYPGKQEMKILFIFHHLLVDGRGALQIAEEFANDYVEGIKPDYAEEQIMYDISVLPAKSDLPLVSRLLVNKANSNWKKENRIVDYDTYSEFVKNYYKSHKVEHRTFVKEASEVSKMLQLCHENDFTMNDLIMAHTYLQTGTKKIIIAADIRKSVSNYNTGALGNYATAMGIVCRSREKDVVELAKKVHRTVRKNMSKNSKLMLVLACYFDMCPTLIDAAAISGLGGFESKTGKFVGSGMFGFGNPSTYSISNLGNVDNHNIRSLMFIPPASPATKLILGIVTMNGVMRICTSEN